MQEAVSRFGKDSVESRSVSQSLKISVDSKFEVLKNRFSHLEAKYEDLDNFARRPVDYYQRIDQMGNSVRSSLKKEMDKLLEKVLSSVIQQETQYTETKFTIERIDRMYKRIKDDCCRHETLAFELATKFDHQHNAIVKMVESIENLKTYAFVNDLHIQTYQPF